jgi:hypothetical protein
MATRERSKCYDRTCARCGNTFQFFARKDRNPKNADCCIDCRPLVAEYDAVRSAMRWVPQEPATPIPSHRRLFGLGAVA